MFGLHLLLREWSGSLAAKSWKAPASETVALPTIQQTPYFHLQICAKIHHIPYMADAQTLTEINN